MYWLDSEAKVRSVQLNQENNIPIEAKIERFDLQFVNRDNRPNPKYETLFVGGIHSDEHEASEIFDNQISLSFQFPHLKIMNAHLAASMFNRREFPLPLSENELAKLKLENIREVAILVKGSGNALGLDQVIEAYHPDVANAKLGEIFKINPECAAELALQRDIRAVANLVKDGKTKIAQEKLDILKPKLLRLSNGTDWVLVRRIDFNRQFLGLEQINYPEAKMFLQLIRDHSEIKYLFSNHEDLEHGSDDFITRKKHKGREDVLFGESGVYFYDMHWQVGNDPDHDLVQELRSKFINRSIKCGFRTLNGTDNPFDPALDNLSDHGYIDQPNADQNGKLIKLDGSLESFFVEMGRLGLTKAERAFSLEVSGRLSPERKLELMEIYNEELILPFLEAHGIGQVQRESSPTF